MGDAPGLPPARRVRIVLTRLWVRGARGHYVGECLELGIVVEGEDFRETIQALKEAYKAFKSLVATVSKEGGIPEWRPVRFYPLKVLEWELSYRLVRWLESRKQGTRKPTGAQWRGDPLVLPAR